MTLISNKISQEIKGSDSQLSPPFLHMKGANAVLHPLFFDPQPPDDGPDNIDGHFDKWHRHCPAETARTGPQKRLTSISGWANY